MSKQTLNKINLEALGAEQLATLLLDVSTGNADIKRRLRLELSYKLGAGYLAHELSKRLASLKKAKGFISWRKRKAVIKDLSIQVSMITEKVAPTDPDIAFDLLWQFIEIATSIYSRVDDSKGDVRAVFEDAKHHLETLAPRVNIDVLNLADRVWAALNDNENHQWDGIISLVGPALGPLGLERLKANVQSYSETPDKAGSDDHEAIKFLRELRGGTNYVAQRKADFVKSCLQEIATIGGDVDALIAQFSEGELKQKENASEIAILLMSDNRTDEAIDALLNATQDASRTAQAAWDDAYIACLVSQEKTSEAQAHRWTSFLNTLNLDHLRGHLKLLPDFEDVETEELAKRHVLDFPNFMQALEFCLNWPDLITAAVLIEDRNGEIEGGRQTELIRAVEALRIRFPLSAAILLRATIDYILDYGQASKYADAAEYLNDCATLDTEIVDYGTVQSHTQYLRTLQAEHERKTSFWAKTQL